MDANRICIVVFPPPVYSAPLNNVIKLLSSLSNRLYVITSKKSIEESRLPRNVRLIAVDYKIGFNQFERIVNFLRTQANVLYNLLRIQKGTDIFLFFLGGEMLIIPFLILKVLRKKIIVMLGGEGVKSIKIKKEPFSVIMELAFVVVSGLADLLSVYSERIMRIIRSTGLGKLSTRFKICHEHFVDFSRFMLAKKVPERPNLVGYIGRLSEEKGILNLIDTIPFVLKSERNVNFVIIGQGHLIHAIGKKIAKVEGMEDRVKLINWLNHQDVPEFLNQLRLLVLPSLTEGLPNVMLEAMACGTPVLATPVGAIPDIIKEGKTGFLLKSNDPKHTAERIIELLSKPDLLERVSINAYNYVRENFSYEKTLETWRKIISELVAQK